MPSYRLKNRNRPVPGGCAFYDSATNYKADQYADFRAQCLGVQQARLANPGLVKRYRKSTDLAAIEEEVDAFWSQFAHDHGYSDFYVTFQREPGGGAGAAAIPFPTTSLRNPPLARIARVAKAAVASLEWIKNASEAVAPELSSKRAKVCVACPKNNHAGDWLSLFTVPAAAAIKKALETKAGMKLSTPDDDKLGVCEACDCPLSLKVHLDLKRIIDNTPKEVYDDFHPDCWIKAENK